VAAQAAVQPGARDRLADELAHDSQQVVRGHQQSAAQLDSHALLCARQNGLQAVRGVRQVVRRGALLPLESSGGGDAEPAREGISALAAGGHLSAEGRSGAGVLMQGNQHDETTPLRSLLICSINPRMPLAGPEERVAA